MKCQHYIRSREQAGKILKVIIASASIYESPAGVAIIAATLTADQVSSLCAWEAACEDCEDSFDREEDRTAPWVEPK